MSDTPAIAWPDPAKRTALWGIGRDNEALLKHWRQAVPTARKISVVADRLPETGECKRLEQLCGPLIY